MNIQLAIQLLSLYSGEGIEDNQIPESWTDSDFGG
jgi:hypothetical protein